MRIHSASLHVHLILFPHEFGIDVCPQINIRSSVEGTELDSLVQRLPQKPEKYFLEATQFLICFCLWRALSKIPEWRRTCFNTISPVRELKWKSRRHLKIGLIPVLLTGNNISTPVHKEQSQRITQICLNPSWGLIQAGSEVLTSLSRLTSTLRSATSYHWEALSVWHDAGSK